MSQKDRNPGRRRACVRARRSGSRWETSPAKTRKLDIASLNNWQSKRPRIVQWQQKAKHRAGIEREPCTEPPTRHAKHCFGPLNQEAPGKAHPEQLAAAALPGSCSPQTNRPRQCIFSIWQLDIPQHELNVVFSQNAANLGKLSHT